ncbi:leucine-rich repeat protein soc-2 homolog [Saccostrea echinata]|uniref:leucine-rich repeat protein soc-2 homolog n=1 Tax=Saccostrea echinata TaxID=191078 RepID=UPI002A7FE34B|nr:leucine-rich repeat protein soc-2 homolog [Saccostrea echinata]
MAGASENEDYREKVIGGVLDLSSEDLVTLPPQIVNGIGPDITKLQLDFNDIKELPLSFGEVCVNLQVLSLVGNQLKEFPQSVGSLSQLKELNVNENELRNLPDSVCKLCNLEVLKLTGNQLQMLPNDLGEIRSLKAFYCDENKLTKLPLTLGLFTNLEILELSDNSLVVIQEGIGQLRSLKIFNVSNNKLEKIHNSLGDLENLEIVDLSRNHLESLPDHFHSVKCVQKFYADRNRLADIPLWVADMSEALEISLSDNQFSKCAINEKMGCTCTKLTLLDIGGNFMDQLPDTFGSMKNLETLRLGSCIGELERRAFQNGNWLTYLPKSFCELTRLTILYLDENLLQELPDDFGNLINLEFIDLGQNALHELPESFCKLKSLKVCQLSKNKIQILPSAFGDLSALEDLHLDNNLLEELPESLNKLTGLKSLDLFNNKLTEIPEALGYFKQLVRLDLSENCFNIPWYDVPQIVRQSHYPPRNPELKNNWRGRARQDLSMMEDKIIKMDVATEELDFEPPPKDLGFSENLLRDAVEHGMSFWRSHEGKGRRQKFVRRDDFNFLQVRKRRYSQEEEEDEEDDDTEDEEDDFEPPIFHPKGNICSPVSNMMDEGYKAVTEATEAEENWDDELEDVDNPFDVQYDDNYFNNIYQHPRPKTLAEAGYTVDDHLCLPYDMHVQPVAKDRTEHQVEAGQFDDDSEEDVT